MLNLIAAHVPVGKHAAEDMKSLNLMIQMEILGRNCRGFQYWMCRPEVLNGVPIPKANNKRSLSYIASKIVN